MAFKQVGIPARIVVDRLKKERIGLLGREPGGTADAEFSEATGAATPAALRLRVADRREEDSDPPRRGGGSAVLEACIGMARATRPEERAPAQALASLMRVEGDHASSPSLAARRRPRLLLVGSDGWTQ